ncbi:unnamed protein product [Periconia digitata]|uniref:Uncharacterized protein n=1 Tax=Periconia digitata TaxID=1303443 RepID=A0A9W4UUA6_9PLEO|nr:unnamed protein product [Periconia digitata]
MSSITTPKQTPLSSRRPILPIIRRLGVAGTTHPIHMGLFSSPSVYIHVVCNLKHLHASCTLATATYRPTHTLHLIPTVAHPQDVSRGYKLLCVCSPCNTYILMFQAAPGRQMGIPRCCTHKPLQLVNV